MIRTQIYLTEEQVENLKFEKINNGRCKSSVIRIALDRYFMSNQFRIVEENKKTGIKVNGSWLKTRSQAQLIIDSLGKKKSNSVYYIQQRSNK